jgi:hypothetical protein
MVSKRWAAIPSPDHTAAEHAAVAESSARIFIGRQQLQDKVMH